MQTILSHVFSVAGVYRTVLTINVPVVYMAPILSMIASFPPSFPMILSIPTIVTSIHISHRYCKWNPLPGHFPKIDPLPYVPPVFCSSSLILHPMIAPSIPYPHPHPLSQREGCAKRPRSVAWIS